MARLSAWRNLAYFAGFYQGINVATQVEKYLRVMGLWERRVDPVGTFSRGMKQRLALARALLGEPQVLFLDEPTASVDSQVSASIYELLRRLNETITILLISHNTDVIASYVKTVGCVNRRLFYHNEPILTPEMLGVAFQCPVDLVAHGVPHRVFPEHDR